MLKLFKNYKKMSDAELMRRFQSDDSEAFEEIFNRYESRMLGFFIRFLSNREEAEDLLQDLFLKVMDKKHSFNPDFSFQPWIFRVASNLAKSHYKKNRRLAIDVVEDLEWENSEEIDRIALQKQIRLAINQLDETHRITFILRHYHQLSVREIATILECKEGTIKSRLYTANQKLKQLFIKQEISSSYE